MSNFVKIWLIDSKFNNNRWRVTWDSIKKHVNSFIDRPIIYYKVCDADNECNLEHIEDGQTYEQSLAAQQPYEIGVIKSIELDESTETAYAIAEIPDEKYKEQIESVGTFSPSVYITNKLTTILDEEGMTIHDWKGIHTALVENPAYGNKAKVEETCEGNESECQSQLTAKETPCIETRIRHAALAVRIEKALKTLR